MIKLQKTIITLSFIISITSINIQAKKEPFLSEDKLAKTLFNVILNKDSIELSKYCVSNENLKTLTNSLNEDSPKEKEIKAELLTMKPEEERSNAFKGFKNFFESINAEKLDIKDAKYSGVVNIQERFATENVKCVSIRFKTSFKRSFYLIRIDMFTTSKEMVVFDIKPLKYENINLALSSHSDKHITISSGESINTVLEFDAEAANKAGAWIETIFDDKIAGMYASTNIESPYNNEIPSKVLTKGEHTLVYRIHPSGQKKYRFLGEVKLGIEVK